MSMKIITGSTGQKHVTSNNDGEFNAGIYAEKTVLQLGNCLKATLVDNNTITIADGDLIFQGRHALIEPDTTETITISTGQIGFNRLDLIVAKYKLDTSTGYESLELEVLEGSQSAGDPVLPAIATGDIRKGATEVDFPLYQVKIEGVTITEVKKLFKERSESIADEILSTGKKIEALNSNLIDLIVGSIPIGDTSITLTNAKITTDSIIDIYFRDKVLAPTNVTVTNGQIVIEIDEQETITEVGVRCL